MSQIILKSSSSEPITSTKLRLILLGDANWLSSQLSQTLNKCLPFVLVKRFRFLFNYACQYVHRFTIVHLGVMDNATNTVDDFGYALGIIFVL